MILESIPIPTKTVIHRTRLGSMQGPCSGKTDYRVPSIHVWFLRKYKIFQSPKNKTKALVAQLRISWADSSSHSNNDIPYNPLLSPPSQISPPSFSGKKKFLSPPSLNYSSLINDRLYQPITTLKLHVDWSGRYDSDPWPHASNLL